MNNGSHRIVLTGGPGGGKTTALDLIRRELGERVAVVPETATILFSGGFPRRHEKEACELAQKSIFHVQRNMEDIQRSLYPDRVLLCDRGTIDGAAYWPNGVEDFFTSQNMTMKEEFKRYDAVIFFESAAVGNFAIDNGNPIRTESNKQAIELDTRLRELWAQHPHFVYVPHQESFFAKIKNAVEAIQKILA